MEFNCILNERHKWIPTGNVYSTWADVHTGGSCPPEGAPVFMEQKCCRCGSLRQVIVKKGNDDAEFVS